MFNKFRFFCVFIDRDERQEKTEELGQYTAILTSITHVYQGSHSLEKSLNFRGSP